MPARLSIVIPNWNGKRFLATCLESLRQQSYYATEIILVDNASTDGSQSLIKAEYTEVRLIELDENRGFTGACNIGMAAATGEFVALLNNDTEVDREWAEQVVQAFGRQPDAGIVASKMLLFDRRDHFPHRRRFFYDGWTGGQSRRLGIGPRSI